MLPILYPLFLQGVVLLCVPRASTACARCKPAAFRADVRQAEIEVSGCDCPLQTGFVYEAMVTAVTLPILIGEVHIMCAAHPETPPTLDWHLRALLSHLLAQRGPAYGRSRMKPSPGCSPADLAQFALHLCDSMRALHVYVCFGAQGQQRSA